MEDLLAPARSSGAFSYRNETMRISPVGALVGAILCAIGRSLVVLSMIQKPVLILMLPSAGIGLLVGAIAGAIGRPLVSAVTGALLSAIVFELFLLPCVSLIGTFGDLSGNTNAESEFVRSTLKYLIGMAVAGGIGGGVGGAIGRLNGKAQTQPKEDSGIGEKIDEPKKL
jgi:hypothetical protein